jgi:hypothetical protein
VIIGGIWAYLKFVRGRTYKPRLSVGIAAQWRDVEDVGQSLQVRVLVTNIGASQVTLQQYGTGLQISFPAPEQPAPPWEVGWEPVPLRDEPDTARTFEILTEHAWIEPGETVSEDLLLNLDRQPIIAMLEVNLIWALSRRWGRRRGDQFSGKDVEVFARRIIPPATAMIDTRGETPTEG